MPQVHRAAIALLAWAAKRRASDATDLLQSDKSESISLVFGLKKVPKNPSNKPRAMYAGGTSTPSLCVSVLRGAPVSCVEAAVPATAPAGLIVVV